MPSVRGLTAAIWLAWVIAVPSAFAQTTAPLDELLRSAKSAELVEALRSGRYQDIESDSWLRRQADEGHAVAQYELAMRAGKHNLDEALKWYARARMARVLDTAACARVDNAAVFGLLLDRTYQDLEGFAQDAEAKFSVSVQEALEWEASNPSRPTAKWICGDSNPSSLAGDVQPEPARQAARKKARDFLAMRAKTMAERQQLLTQPINPGQYEVRDAPVVGAPMRWLDNRRLYIHLHDKLPKELQERMPYATNVIWNVDTGSIEPTEVVMSTNVCYREGRVGYGAGKGDSYYYYEGSFGSEKVVMRQLVIREGRALPLEERVFLAPDGKTWPASAGFHINRFTCRLERQERLGTRFKTPLLDGHGFLSSSHLSVRYHTAESDPGITIPIDYGDVHHSLYADFLGMYVIPSGLLTANSTSALSFWMLEPRGTVKEEIVPGGPWFAASQRYRVSRAGIVIWSNNRGRGADFGFAGIYLARNGQVVRILAGLPGLMDVTPDGCRIAVQLGRGTHSELKLVDVCKEKGG